MSVRWKRALISAAEAPADKAEATPRITRILFNLPRGAVTGMTLVDQATHDGRTASREQLETDLVPCILGKTPHQPERRLRIGIVKRHDHLGSRYRFHLSVHRAPSTRITLARGS